MFQSDASDLRASRLAIEHLRCPASEPWKQVAAQGSERSDSPRASVMSWAVTRPDPARTAVTFILGMFENPAEPLTAVPPGSAPALGSSLFTSPSVRPNSSPMLKGSGRRNKKISGWSSVEPLGQVNAGGPISEAQRSVLSPSPLRQGSNRQPDLSPRWRI